MAYSTSQQAMIVDAFNSTTYVANQMDVQNTPLYDSVTIPATMSLSPLTSSLFTNVGPASGKTYAQTNMQQQRLLPSPEAFSIFGFRFRYSEDLSILDIWNILNGFCYEFWMGNKNYQRGPIWFYNAGGGIYGVATNSAVSIYNNGMPGRTEMHKLAITIVIENQMNFYGLLNGTAYTLDTNGNGITFYSLLDGLYARGVQ